MKILKVFQQYYWVRYNLYSTTLNNLILPSRLEDSSSCVYGPQFSYLPIADGRRYGEQILQCNIA